MMEWETFDEIIGWLIYGVAEYQFPSILRALRANDSFMGMAIIWSTMIPSSAHDNYPKFLYYFK